MNITAQLAQALRAIVARHNGDFDRPALLSFGPMGTAAEDIQRIATEALAAYDDASRPLAVGDRVRVLRSDYPVSCPEGMETEVMETFGDIVCVRGTRQSPSSNGAWTFLNPSAELERIA